MEILKKNGFSRAENKTNIEYSLNRFNIRSEMAEERSYEFEDRAINSKSIQRITTTTKKKLRKMNRALEICQTM